MSKTKRVNAAVTELFTDGYIEVALLEGDGKPGKRRGVAECFDRVRRGDIVEVEPAKPFDEPLARIAYLAVPVFFAFGAIINRGELLDRVLSGLILAGLVFVLAWLMNRRARLRRRLEYRVTRIVESKDD